MIAEQLQAARTAHWRQQNPLLTLEDAQSWLGQHPLCLYLPRRAQLPSPAPSFVEATLGKPQTMPGADAIEQAQSLLTRLTASGAVVPLNLLGTIGEQPDFLATREALPAVLSLRADADWKHAPQKSSGHKVSPLVLELWKLLELEGSLTASEARTALGRELTEAAVLRALAELWQGLRISPVYGEDGQPARWEMMRVRHREALTTAAATGQVTAISLLVSMYLQSVYAATNEEIEVFLSPVTSRSRVREAVRGLSATRQIHSLSMQAQTYYFLENGLPEFATVAVSPAVEDAPTPIAARPKRREHPLAPAPGAAAMPRPARPEQPAAQSGWKSPRRTSDDSISRRPPQTADPSAPIRSGRDDKAGAARPGTFSHTGAPPRAKSDGERKPPFKPRSAPARSGSADGPRPWRPKTTTGPSGRDDKERAARPGGFARAGAPPRSGPPRSGSADGPRPWRPKTTTGPSGRDDKERAARPGGFARAGAPPRSGPPRSGSADGPRPWRPKTTAGPSTREDKGKAARPGGFARAGAPPRSGPPRSGSADGPRPWRPKTTAGPSTRDDKARVPRPGGFARTGASSRPRTGGARTGGEGRAPFKPRTGPPRSGPAGGSKPWRPKTATGSSARDNKGSAPRPGGFARTGVGSRSAGGGKGGAPFKSRSGPPRSGPAGGEGRPPFKPRSGAPKGGPRKPGKGPGDYPRRKPDRKKPGA